MYLLIETNRLLKRTKLWQKLPFWCHLGGTHPNLVSKVVSQVHPSPYLQLMSNISNLKNHKKKAWTPPPPPLMKLSYLKLNGPITKLKCMTLCQCSVLLLLLLKTGLILCQCHYGGKINKIYKYNYILNIFNIYKSCLRLAHAPGRPPATYMYVAGDRPGARETQASSLKYKSENKLISIIIYY